MTEKRYFCIPLFLFGLVLAIDSDLGASQIALSFAAPTGSR